MNVAHPSAASTEVARKIGSAEIFLRYVGITSGTVGTRRHAYTGRVEAGGRTFRFERIYSPVFGFPEPTSNKAYDFMAREAVSLGTTKALTTLMKQPWLPEDSEREAITSAVRGHLKKSPATMPAKSEPDEEEDDLGGLDLVGESDFE